MMNVKPKVIYCPSCGVDSDSYCNFCKNCGTFLKESQSPQVKKGLGIGDKILIFLGTAFVSPVIGYILYFIWKHSETKKAKQVSRLTWWAFGVWVISRVAIVIILIRTINLFTVLLQQM